MNRRGIFMHNYHLQLIGIDTYDYVTPNKPQVHQDVIALLKQLSVPYKIMGDRLVLSSGEVSLTAHAPEQKSDILNCILQEWHNDGVSKYE